ncbi:hypothetical protein HY478_02745, partial [Candidatus Uhrbacteria bacterium]|nr:hypothetical protein [Candidatus Uhrbacteria bacterium]
MKRVTPFIASLLALTLLGIGCARATSTPESQPGTNQAPPAPQARGPSVYSCAELLTLNEALIDCGDAFRTPNY